jgi:CubicO group peptidase (beta-lactamase class C family)
MVSPGCRATAVFLAAVVLVTATTVADDHAVTGRPNAAIQQAHGALHGFVESSPIPGLSVAVAIEGKVVWAHGFGMADLEQRVPARADTVYRVASVSKPLTAAVASRLAGAGRMNLDAPIRELVPASSLKTRCCFHLERRSRTRLSVTRCSAWRWSVPPPRLSPS